MSVTCPTSGRTGNANLSSTGGPLEGLTAATISLRFSSPGFDGASDFFDLWDLLAVAAPGWLSPELHPATPRQLTATAADQKVAFFQQGPNITSSSSCTADCGK